MGFSGNLKSLRKAKGMTQIALADKLGVKRQTVVEWENPNGKRPDFFNLTCLVTALQCSWNKLMDGEVQRVKEVNPNWAHCKGLVVGLRFLASSVEAITADVLTAPTDTNTKGGHKE